MSTHPADRIAAVIRQVPHPADRIAAVIRQFPHPTDADTLGAAIAQHLGGDSAGCTEVVADIVRKVDPNQTMGAGALGEAIWDDLTGDVPRWLRQMVNEIDDAYTR